MNRLQSKIDILEYDVRNELSQSIENFKKQASNIEREEEVQVYISEWLAKDINRQALVKFMVSEAQKAHPKYFRENPENLPQFRLDLDYCLKWTKLSLDEDATERQDIILELMASVLVQDKSSRKLYQTALKSILDYSNFTRKWGLKITKIPENQIKHSSLLEYYITELFSGLEDEYFIF